MKKNNEEKRFEEQVKEFLKSQGIYPLGIEKQKMSVPSCGYYEKRWGNAFTPSGLPDMHLVINGLSLEIELKAANGRPSELQKKKLDQIVESGGIGFILYPKDFEKFQNLIKGVKKLSSTYRKIEHRTISYAFGDWNE